MTIHTPALEMRGVSKLFPGVQALKSVNLMVYPAEVVAVIGEEATVKKYIPEKNRIRLEPANPIFEPIIVDRRSPEFRIAGKVIGLLRKM